MKFLQSKLLFLFLILYQNVSFGQIPRPEHLSERTDSLRKDFLILRDLLENKYPSLYRFSSKAEINHLLDSCYHSLNGGTTDFEFYKVVKQVFSAIKDGHLYCDPPPQIRKYLDTKAKFFPLKLKFINDKAFVLKSADRTVPLKAEILSINEKSIDEVSSQLFRFIVSDGDIRSKKFNILDNFFYLYYYMAYGENEKFEIKFKNAEGKTQHAVISASLMDKMDIDSKKNTSDTLLNLNFTSGNTAIMRINTFDRTALTENGENFESFLAAAFKKIQRNGTNKLIIDLRGNTGGRDTYGALLYSYLTDRSFRYYRKLQAATKDLAYNQLQKSNSSFDNLSRDMLEQVGEKKFYLREEAHPNLRVWKPNRLNYKGKVWFLIDGLSFSTTAEFCAIARENNRGKFIGEETGGGMAGNTSGNIVEQTLPSTGVTAYLGMIQYEMNINKVGNLNRGIIPDYQVKLDGLDINSDKDPYLNFALKLARED